VGSRQVAALFVEYLKNSLFWNEVCVHLISFTQLSESCSSTAKEDVNDQALC
jgi:hypothetical protein